MIGVFDSGLGGLAALRPLKELLPRADFVYFADTEALPLGERTEADIIGRTLRALGFFSAMGAHAVLLACGTASSLFPEKCKESFAFPIFDIIKPTAAAVKQLPKGTQTVLLSTEAAARAGVFACALAGKDTPVLSLACPALVALAEGKRPPSDDAVARALAPVLPLCPTGVVLGCTHFSLLAPHVARLLPRARLFDAAACGAAALAASIREADAAKGEATTRFFVTGETRRFDAGAARVLGHPVTAKRISLPDPALFSP